MQLTSIQVTNEIKETLNSMKKKGESYEDVIKRLIEKSKEVKKIVGQPKMEETNTRKELKPVRLIGWNLCYIILLERRL